MPRLSLRLHAVAATSVARGGGRIEVIGVLIGATGHGRSVGQHRDAAGHDLTTGGSAHDVCAGRNARKVFSRAANRLPAPRAASESTPIKVSEKRSKKVLLRTGIALSKSIQ
jgi:hypothetical protein